jgi:starvation-inducible DNA-binding protein
MQTINIGLTDRQRTGVIDLLNHDLADAYLLLVKTKKYHWDVVGPQFMTLHKLWEEQYAALSDSIDEIAERIRTLGGYPVGTMAGCLQLASLKEDPGDVPMATGMVARLVVDHDQIIRNLRQHIDACSDTYQDQGTADFLTALMEAHEKMAWMLRSFIEGEGLASNGDRQSVNQPSAVGA